MGNVLGGIWGEKFELGWFCVCVKSGGWFGLDYVLRGVLRGGGGEIRDELGGDMR